VHKGSVTTVQSSANPAHKGQAVTITATVKARTPASGTPVGLVTFLVDGKAVRTMAPSTAGQASLLLGALDPGQHRISARYGGAGLFVKSSSTTLVQT